MLNALISELKSALPRLEMRENEPLKAHTSFRIGGAARLMLLPESRLELETLARLLFSAGVRPFILGNGSNLLFPDEGYDGVIIKTALINKIEKAGDNIIRAESGALLSQAASFAAKNSLSGMEFAHGIPGSVGGAVIMNAGAYGGEMADIAVKTVYLNEKTEKCAANGAEQEFSYRHSRFSSGDIILYTELRLENGSEAEIRAEMDELKQKRRASQPLELPSAGSAFKRPEGGFAARLIDEAGLKGLKVGGAQVSEKHAGFIVNTGGATAADVLKLIEKIQAAVFAASGIRLEPEIRIVKPEKAP